MTQTTYRGLDDAEIAILDEAVHIYQQERTSARERLGLRIREAQAQFVQEVAAAARARDAVILHVVEAGPYGTQARVATHLDTSPAYIGKRLRLARESLKENVTTP